MEVAKEAYLKFFSTNPLYSSIFKSLAQMEREIVEMTAGLHHGPTPPAASPPAAPSRS